MGALKTMTAAAAGTLVLACAAHAQVKPYGGIGVGAGTVTNGGGQTGARITLGAGAVFGRNRLELEGTSGLGGGDTDELASLSAILVTYAREFQVAPTTRFYLGAGLGGGAFDTDLLDDTDGDFGDSESAIVGQVGAGFVFDLPGPIAFDVGARVQSYNGVGNSQDNSSLESVDGLVRLIIGR